MKTKIFDQHAEHSEWINKLLFYGVEIKIMQKRLEEMMGQKFDPEVMKLVEHFQNQIIIQTSNIGKLQKQIKQDEKELVSKIAENPIASDHRSAPDHEQEREMLESFESNFNSLRKEFNAFLAQNIAA